VISRRFNDGDVIYRCGEAAVSAFEVRAGRVRLTWPGDGALAPSAVLSAGQVFGAAELISGGVRIATAEALGEADVCELGREELARLLAQDADLARTVLHPAFEQLRREQAAAARARAKALREAIAAPRMAEPVVLSELRLKPAGREVSHQMGPAGVRIAALPFHVGRRSARGAPEDGDSARIDLVLDDSRPYSLSRRHFAIETVDGGYVVRDCRSHFGTIVNGAPIGGELPATIAPLGPGENEIVAGKSASPFRFTLTIDGA
jgi:CRP-like cAMP-binding protein